VIHGHVLPFWRGVLKTITAFASGIEIEIGDGRSIWFWLDHWVSSNILAIKLPNLLGLALDPSTMVDSQLCHIDGHVIWAS